MRMMQADARAVDEHPRLCCRLIRVLQTDARAGDGCVCYRLICGCRLSRMLQADVRLQSDAYAVD